MGLLWFPARTPVVLGLRCKPWSNHCISLNTVGVCAVVRLHCVVWQVLKQSGLSFDLLCRHPSCLWHARSCICLHAVHVDCVIQPGPDN